MDFSYVLTVLTDSHSTLFSADAVEPSKPWPQNADGMLGAALAGRALPAADNVGGACRLPLVPLREANAGPGFMCAMGEHLSIR